MSEQLWARVGKVLAGVTAVIGILLGGAELSDRFGGPRLIAVVDELVQSPTPEMTRKIAANAIREAEEVAKAASADGGVPSSTELTTFFKKNREAGEQQTLTFLGKRNDWIAQSMFELEIRNEGSGAAEDVRVLIPGEGSFELVESHFFRFVAEVTNYKREFSVGTIPPQGSIHVRVWPKESLLGAFGGDITVLHADGAATMYEAHKFWGWSADLAYWFLRQGGLVRHGGPVMLLVLLVVGVGWRRGHIVFRRRPEK